MSEWISASEGLPEEGETILIWATRLGIRLGVKLPEIISNPVGIRPDGCMGYDEDVTHWMPLPEPPESSDETD